TGAKANPAAIKATSSLFTNTFSVEMVRACESSVPGLSNGNQSEAGTPDFTKLNDYIDFCCRLQRDHRCLNSLVASVQRRFNTWSCLPSVRCQPWALPRSLARCLPWVLSQSWARHRRWSSLRSWAPAWQPCVSSAWLSSAQPWSHRLSWLPGRRRQPRAGEAGWADAALRG